MLSRVVICSPAFKYMGFGSRASGSKVRTEIKEFYVISIVFSIIPMYTLLYSSFHLVFHYPYTYYTHRILHWGNPRFD